MRLFTLVLIGLIMISPVFAKNEKQMKNTFIGCDTKETYDRALKMMLNDDWEAVSRLVLSGKCIQLNKGEIVYLDDSSWGIV